MKVWKTTAILLLSGLLVSLGSCATDVGYYLLSALSDYLPDILNTLTETSTTTS